MRFIHGITGCKVGRGVDEIESSSDISVRIIDCADGLVALRIGTHNESARMTPDEARHIGFLLTEAAERAEARVTGAENP